MFFKVPIFALDIQDLKKTYFSKKGKKSVEALKGTTLQIEQGAYFGLLGPNGAGKSTLINILSSTVTPTSGRVSIMGRNLFKTPLEAKKFIGIVPQEITIDFFFSPYESLELMAGYYGVPPKERKTKELLEIFGLADKANAYVRELSGGMKRRLLVAKALVHDPHVLILDEPTAGVDINLRQTLWEYVTHLNKEKGTTVILTTHYLEEAESLCNDLAFIRKGEIVASGKKRDLLARLDKKTLRARLAADATCPNLEGLESEHLKVRWNDQERTLEILYTPSKISIRSLLSLLEEKKIPFIDIATEEGNLDDLFVSLTS